MKLRDDVSFDGTNMIEFETAGQPHRSDYSFWRGEGTTFHPSDDDMAADGALAMLTKGMPAEPFISRSTSIVAFGSCFADNVSSHLHERGFNVATKKDTVAHISRIGDGIVNTFAVLQQFQWAWEKRVPWNVLWHGYDAQAFGYDDEIRLATKAMLDRTDVFIITLGLSEIWFDEPTGEVFWRAVPADRFDPVRHKFRVASQAENLRNLRRIVDLIAEHRPGARVIFTLSPIPLTATFRTMSCIAANGASKANLRSALDELIATCIPGVSYFPAYDLALSCFNNQFMEDRRHLHLHVIQFIMALFERFYCGSIPAEDLQAAYDHARHWDQKVGADGHWSVDRSNLKYSKRAAS
jgi:hypothetical protein